MKTKINCVLLVDDDEATNFIHQHVIKAADFAEQVKIAENGQQALEYLTATDHNDYVRPDLIFLDINMPVMNGWEFLEQYKQLDEELQGQMMVVMLTTSLNPDNKTNSESLGSIDHFMSKPLTIGMLENLQSRIFDLISL